MTIDSRFSRFFLMLLVASAGVHCTAPTEGSTFPDDEGASPSPTPRFAPAGSAPAADAHAGEAPAPLLSRWTVGEWSACSAACGGGVRTRDVICAAPGGAVSEGSGCEGDAPASSEACNVGACTYSWETTPWGACVPLSGTCGGGARTRTASCMRVDDEVTVDGVLCAIEAPETTQACDVPCVTPPTLSTMQIGADTFSVMPSTYSDASAFQISGTSCGPDGCSQILVAFRHEPTGDADFAPSDVSPSDDAHAYVFASALAGAWWTSSQSAPIRVRRDGDGKLHAYVDDPAMSGAGSSVAIQADFAW